MGDLTNVRLICQQILTVTGNIDYRNLYLNSMER